MNVKKDLYPSELLHNNGLYSDTGYGIIQHLDHSYHIRRLTLDEKRQTEYQQLRADVFIRQFGWAIPIDAKGRDRDYYDRDLLSGVTIHCTYGYAQNTSHLLGGVRIFELNNWSESMLWNEFSAAELIPKEILSKVQETYNVHRILELTRFCIQRGRQNNIFPSLFDLSVARDYTYASVYAYAERLKRPYALALVHHTYFLVLQKAQFIFDIVYTHFHASKKADRYALIMIHLPATIHALSQRHTERAARMMSLCSMQSWMYHQE